MAESSGDEFILAQREQCDRLLAENVEHRAPSFYFVNTRPLEKRYGSQFLCGPIVSGDNEIQRAWLQVWSGGSVRGRIRKSGPNWSGPIESADCSDISLFASEAIFTAQNSGYSTGLERTPRFCPPIFDGFLCWHHTPGATLAKATCPPNSVIGPSWSNGVATKLCVESGEWYRNEHDVTWSNYSLCTKATPNQRVWQQFDQDETGNSTMLRKWLPVIKMVSQVGYASSLATLLIAFVIFAMIRKLRNPRNRLHMHLFASFIMRAFMALLKNWLFVDGVGLAWDIIKVDGKNTFVQEHNTWLCKTITSLWQYFIVANYAWILMEGLYLHNLVFLALCTDTTAITLYIFLGWGLPCMVVVPWIAVRATFEDTLCWTTHSNPSLFFIIRIPIMISILFNFVLFVNIVRVLLVKLKTSVYLQRKKMRYRRWAKSTLVLVPLFGAHYALLLGFSYHKDQRVELLWLFCDQLFASFQGCFVALLYCFFNDEVRAEVKRTWRARRSRRGGDSLSLAQRELPRLSNLRATCRHHQIDTREQNVDTTPTVVSVR